MTRLRSFVLLAPVLWTVAGCDLFTGPEPLEEFHWVELTHGRTLEERVDVTANRGEVFFLGELNTPTTCYALTPEFEQNGSRLTLLVKAREVNTASCQQILGAFRYTGVLRHLGNGTYELTIVHDVDGETRTFTHTVTI